MGLEHRLLVMHSAILRACWTIGHFVLPIRKQKAPPLLLSSVAAGLTEVQEGWTMLEISAGIRSHRKSWKFLGPREMDDDDHCAGTCSAQGYDPHCIR
jgi:hypothetical protein